MPVAEKKSLLHKIKTDCIKKSKRYKLRYIRLKKMG